MIIAIIPIHIIIFPKNSKAVLKGDCTGVYNTIKKTLADLQCDVIAVNGTDDHIHIGTNLSPYISMDDLKEEICNAATEFIEKTGSFPNFAGWEKDYISESPGCFETGKLKREIENQKLYHKTHSLGMELRSKGYTV